ncbi:unnamed protein product [Rotaria sordida]|uniref:Uncharacterized protein n=1 Tax=Rotaria sordida TaxID=392033 RepID=A0A815R2A8_9BILA|nr:unnamed protein product [Rotaria sordida]CAF1644852.1 unnamed protein product [Rotaria sordida]
MHTSVEILSSDNSQTIFEIFSLKNALSLDFAFIWLSRKKLFKKQQFYIQQETTPPPQPTITSLILENRLQAATIHRQDEKIHLLTATVRSLEDQMKHLQQQLDNLKVVQPAPPSSSPPPRDVRYQYTDHR